jgi:IS5 family transposase
MAKPRDDRQKDLLRPALEAIIDRATRWCGWRARSIGGFSTSGSPECARPERGSRGRPGWWRGLLILKHTHDLSNEVLCARWVENPYYQFFCGELSFCHRLPFDGSSLTHWRQRLGEEELVALLQENLSVAHKSGALAPRDLERVVVDTTVQPKVY